MSRNKPESAPDRRSFVRKLGAILPEADILSSDEELRPYECDGLSAYRERPMLVVKPGTLEEVQAVIRACHSAGIPITARGAGTGLSGGALPLANGVLLSMARFNKLLEIDLENCCARVQPGVTNLAISQAVKSHGLYYAPDPSSQIACTIGGNVAENSGGVHCLKYGLTVHNILALKAFTVEGEAVEFGSQGLDSPGYDLLALMTGSEGMLAVITEVTVRLLPTPECARVILAAYDDLGRAGDAVGAVIGAGIIPAGMELMDKLAIRAAEDFVHAGYPTDAAAILLCELDGTGAEVNQQIAVVQTLLHEAGATEVRVSADAIERELFWKGRKAAFPAVGRVAPDYYCMDGTIPRKHLADVLRRISDLSGQYGLPVANVFHAGDGNLHPLILYDANHPGELQQAEEFGGKILELCVEVGGTITGEHGVGVEKLNQMCVQFDARELEQFHRIKTAFDADGLLNPGKAVPTLHRCAEFGAMHVHRGKLAFPDIERF